MTRTIYYDEDGRLLVHADRLSRRTKPRTPAPTAKEAETMRRLEARVKTTNASVAEPERGRRRAHAERLVDAAVADGRLLPGERGEWIRKFELGDGAAAELAESVLAGLPPRTSYSAADLTVGEDAAQRAHVARILGPGYVDPGSVI